MNATPVFHVLFSHAFNFRGSRAVHLRSHRGAVASILFMLHSVLITRSTSRLIHDVVVLPTRR